MDRRRRHPHMMRARYIFLCPLAAEVVEVEAQDVSGRLPSGNGSACMDATDGHVRSGRSVDWQ